MGGCQILHGLAQSSAQYSRPRPKAETWTERSSTSQRMGYPEPAQDLRVNEMEESWMKNQVDSGSERSPASIGCIGVTRFIFTKFL